MAETKVTDIIIPEVFNPYLIERTAELSAFFQSGVVQQDDRIALKNGGGEANMPFFQDIDQADQVLSDTVPLTVNNVTSDKDVAVLQGRGNAWGANDLTGLLAGSEPLEAVADFLAPYWARRYQDNLLASLDGVFAAASMSGKVLDITALGAGLDTINGSTFTDAMQLMGDAKGKIVAVAMHSATESSLTKQDLIDFIPQSEGQTEMKFFMGKRVIVDDSLPFTGGDYTTYLFGEGAYGYNENAEYMRTEEDRDILAGSDTIAQRRAFVMHPKGVKWKGTPAGIFPTNVELAVGTNWERVYEAKNVRLVKFEHKI